MNGKGKSFDLIVIGAGSVGLPAAFSFSKAGFRVAVIDRKSSPGQGANKTAIGGVRATHSDRAKISVCQRSIEILSTWKERYGDNVAWRRGGYSFVAYRNQEERTLKELLEIQHAHGLDIDWYDGADLLEIIPDLSPGGLIGGTFSPGDGSASPLLAGQAFYRTARELGASFYFAETVGAIESSRGRVSGVVTDKATYHAPLVLNAAGGHAAETARMAGMDIPVVPDSHEAGVSEPVGRFLEPMVVDIRSIPGSKNFYFYQHDTGQVIFCITPDPPIVGSDLEATSAFLPMVAKRMIMVMPKLKNLRVRRTWRGLYPMTPDGSPLVGMSRELNGFILAVGMCGQGFMLGPGLSDYLVKLVKGELDRDDREVLDQFSPYRRFDCEEMLK